MTILLWGQDGYHRRRKERQLIGDFSRKHSDLGFRSFDLAEPGQEIALDSFLKTQSIFEAYKLALVSNSADSRDKNLAANVKIAQKSQKTLIIFSETEAPVSPWTFLRQKGEKNKEAIEQKFEKLKDIAWRKFVRAEILARELKLASGAEDYLASAHEGDCWGLVTELDKISLWDKKNITKEDLRELGVEVQSEFFPTLMALKSNEIRVRLRGLERLFLENQSAAKIFNIISAQWYDRAEIMAQYDLAVKSGKCDYEEVLLSLVLS
ncbi:MAG TPA: hypothetical protein VJL32_00320 [Candidatus Paceibacterota bacterium]